MRLEVLGLASVIGMVGAEGLAQTAPAPQSVEVTGSRLRSADQEPASPVTVIRAEDIRRSGTTSLVDFLADLPGGGASSRDLGGNGSSASGSSSAGLRGFGSQATLVLLNSRRVAPYPLADNASIFTNIDALPFEAIDRVEILRSGGSALYGSDAMAGVINIITRHDWVGVRANVSREQSVTSGRFGNTTASLTGGASIPGLRDGHLLANVEIYRREGLMWRDVIQYADPAVTSRSSGFGTLSSYSWPGNIIGGGPVAGCAKELIQGGLCRYDRYARFEVVPPAERVNLLLSGGFTLADGRRAFGEILLADNRTTYHSPFQPYGKALSPVTWGMPSTGSVQTFQYRGLPAGHPLNSTGVDDAELRYRFVDGPNQEEPHTQQYRLLAGLSGASNGFDWETAAGLMGGRTRLEQRGWFSLSGFHEVIGNDDPSVADPLFFNRAYRIGQVNSPEVLAKLFPTYGYRGQVEQWFVDGRMNGRLLAGPVGQMDVVFGGELRREHFVIDPSAALRAGDIVGNGLSASDASRIAAAAFAETSIRPMASTELQAAARIDKFDGVSAHISPRLSLKWQPGAAWVVRATAETGFRAPNLVESAESTKYSYDSVSDPRRCPQAQALAADLRTAALRLSANDPQVALLNARADNMTITECQGSIASIVRNNPNLAPETSRNFNVGAVFTPRRDLRISVDAWDIQRRNEIGLRGTVELLAAESVQPGGVINRSPLAQDTIFTAAEQAKYGVTTGALRSVSRRFDNLARTQARGIDVSAATMVATPWGGLELQAVGSVLLVFRNWSMERAGWGDNLVGRSHQRWNLTSSATLHAGTWEHTVRATSYPATSMQGDYYDHTYSPEGCAAAGFSQADCTNPGHTRWDYALRYLGLRDWALGVSVRNFPGTRVPYGVASWLNGGGILPAQSEDARGTSVRLTVEWQPK